MVDAVQDVVSSDFLYCNSRLTYQRNIQKTKLLLQRSNFVKSIENIDEEVTGPRTLGIYPSTMELCTRSGQKKGRF